MAASLEAQRGFRFHDKKGERHPNKSPTLTKLRYLVRCRCCLELSPHFVAPLSKGWDSVGGQGS